MATRISQAHLNNFISPAAAMAPYERAQQSKESALQRDAALRNLITGKEMDGANQIAGKEFDATNENDIAERDLGNARSLREELGQETDVSVGRARIGGVDPLMQLLRRQQLNKPQLTPAQEAAEKESGKAIQTYAVSGGAAGMDKNQNALTEVEKDLGGKRDWYDRTAGKLLGWSPGLLGTVAPTEKARMDKAQAGAVGNIKATDSNPTQALIDQTMSRVYDPRADDAQNIARIKAERQMAESKRQQIEAAKNQYDATGYATIGAPPIRRQGPSAPPATTPSANSGGVDQLSDEQLRALAAQLGIQ